MADKFGFLIIKTLTVFIGNKIKNHHSLIDIILNESYTNEQLQSIFG